MTAPPPRPHAQYAAAASGPPRIPYGGHRHTHSRSEYAHASQRKTSSQGPRLAQHTRHRAPLAKKRARSLCATTRRVRQQHERDLGRMLLVPAAEASEAQAAMWCDRSHRRSATSAQAMRWEHGDRRRRDRRECPWQRWCPRSPTWTSEGRGRPRWRGRFSWR